MNDLAHDLAIAKLCGSGLSTNEMVSKYYQYLEEFQIELKTHSDGVAETKIIDRNKLGI